MIRYCFIPLIALFCIPAYATSASPENVDQALRELLDHIESVEHCAFLCRFESRTPDGVPVSNRINLVARKSLNASLEKDRTVRVTEECFRIFGSDSTSIAFRMAGAHDGEIVSIWGQTIDTVSSSPLYSAEQIQYLPNAYTWIEQAIYTPLTVLREFKNIVDGQEEKFEVSVDDEGFTLFVYSKATILPAPIRIRFIRGKGVAEIAVTQPLGEYRFLVEEFQQLESGHWIPLRGVAYGNGDYHHPQSTMTVLQALINEEVPLDAFKPLAIAEGEREPPSYIEAFFGVTIQEAFDMLDVTHSGVAGFSYFR